MKTPLSTHLRIIWAITAKDLVDGLKNKNILTLVITSLLVVLMYRYLPALTADDGPPYLLVVAEAPSELVDLLWDSPAVKSYQYDSFDEMLTYLSHGETPELGLVIPAGFDAATAAGNPPELQGYALQVFDDADVLALKRAIEDEIAYLLGQPVSIAVARVPLQPDATGITIMPALGFVFVTLMIGMLVIPHMMIEERQEKTIDALLISPARAPHIIAAKALTGLIYALITLLLALILNWSLIQHAWLFLLAGLLGALFSVSLGMLLGIHFETRQQLTLWGWIILIPLFFPMILVLMDDLFPGWLVSIFKWVPTAAMFRVFRTSMVGATPWAYFAPQLLWIGFCALILFVLDVWLIRRMDR